ncbi:nitrate ABC transporter permease [Aphanizomenon flos-aquae NRERC-008]|jgi:nitrate/nitrite transport system permease protein|uniref:Nitrate ABC transporter permease n=1 Tax=Aphanizomenon flos-aquae FACHB-1249 TaxID=2692889 RepID=A0ABR8IXY2_APHFL|nr:MULTISPECIES: nitrate ABC transporter permease [Aphanizomenon]MCE2906660.1 nitrate ABC transporter permease [Anabaena sp. CoA2_C59]MDJ0506462.1 nitrate ABC transporter permease [Nostocales cyanobacterium LE14-WE12]MBD2391849.1 nitrate ABC transporter permease [Aphanizomenon flos-aquae FACHB-1171]MBD2558254.1 nitrate ABC transporter permease [Aphanizomenon flos-aquae FACHB-1290]MBD2633287.1 nitrate ABC transporter permease [Aphanizomenon sp. FACHB-1399]
MAAIVGSRRVSSKQQKVINKFLIKKVIPPLFGLFVFLMLWELLCLIPSFQLPGPIETIRETWDPFVIHPFFDNGDSDKGLGWQILTSLGRVALGFSLAAVVGVVLGILIGSNTFLYNAVDPIFQVLRTIPPLAWLPISLAAFQQANPSAIFVIFITSIWPIVINTTVGVQNIPQDYVNVARVLRVQKGNYFLKIVFPATVPYIFTGLRIGIGLSWLAIVAAEMLVGGVGIGSFIWDAYNTTTETNMSEIIIALVYVGLVGLVLDRMVAFVADKVVTTEQK